MDTGRTETELGGSTSCVKEEEHMKADEVEGESQKERERQG